MAVTPADAPLLATKLFVPSPRPNRVSRGRLRERLDSAPGGTVTLTAAPAGSGKSTLLADWALATERHVAWLSLEPADDEPRRFVNYVIAALRNAGVIASGDSIVLATSDAPDAIDAVLTELLNAIAQRHAPAVLVLDDYHVIESESVHRIVQWIVDHIPHNLHLVLASRVDPPLRLSRLRARDTLLEIRAADLRFTEDEAELFLNDAMGLALTRDEIEDLDRRTEGWAVGLQMAAISLRGRGGGKDFISSFSGSNRYVLDYLTDEVLLRQSDDVRAFLLDTSILERLSAPLCDAITGRKDSERILEQLDIANLFLIPLDDVRFWYRYHHLFASLLEHELERSASAGDIAELHRRASEWYVSNRMPEPALHHAVAAKDDDRAIAIVSQHASPHLTAGDGSTIARWFEQLPRDRVEKDFDLLMLNATALTAMNRLDDAMREITLAEHVIPEDRRERCEGTVLSIRGMLERMFGETARATATLERAITLLDPKDFWFSMAAFHLGIGAMMETDLAKAERYLDQATECRDQPEGMLTAVLGRTYGGWCRLWQGRPDHAVRMALEANEWIDAWAAKHGTNRPLSSLAYGVLADTHRLWNDLDRAAEYARMAIESGRTGFVIGYVEASRVTTLVAEARGEWDAALAAASETVCRVRCAGNTEMLATVRALEYRVLLRRGTRVDLEKVERWCEESGFFAVDEWRRFMHAGLYSDYSMSIAARMLLIRKRLAEARKLLDALFEEAVATERVPSRISLLILRSLVDAESGDAAAAIAKMRQALDLAAKPRFVQLFVDEGAAIVPILERAAAVCNDRDFATRVLSAFNVIPQRVASTEGLSDREIEVLRLIASGSSNQDAARKLFVAPSTVKKHLENIYAKLGVGGRTQAVARARELRIL